MRALTTVCISTMGVNTVDAQRDPFAPTPQGDRYQALVDLLNSPAGATLRDTWHIDSAIWREPEFFVDATGSRRLVAPAHAEIHAAVPFEYPVPGCQPKNPRVISNIRVLIPRDYGFAFPYRWVIIPPPGRLTEYTSDTNVRVEKPMLRRGHLVIVQNSLYPGFDQIPGGLQDLGRRLNQGTIFALDMLSGDRRLGVPRPTTTLAWAHSRGAHVASMAIECSNPPFDGIVMSSGGSGFVSRNMQVPGLMKMPLAANPADAAAMAPYLADIGRVRTIELPGGTTRTGPVSSNLDAPLRVGYGLSTMAQVLLPVVPPYDRYGVNFRFPANFFDQVIFDAPVSFRALLADVDPGYLADVDAGRALLRDWTPEQRPVAVQEHLREIDVRGTIQTKVLKVHGTRDPQIYVQTEIDYVNKVLHHARPHRAADFRFFLVKGLGHAASQAEELVEVSTGVVRSIGRELHDLEALIRWVETAAPPTRLTAGDPADPSKRLSVPAAQFGPRCDPIGYLERIEGLPGVSPVCETP